MLTTDSVIIAPPSVTYEQAVAFILARPHGAYTAQEISDLIVPVYFVTCLQVDIDPGIALAQMIHETGNLTSFWSQRPQRNPAGIGVNGRRQAVAPADPTGWCFNPQRGTWEVGLSFASWKDDAIPAHVGRLLAYALPAGHENDAQQALLDHALSYRMLPHWLRGSAPILRRLGKRFNPTGFGWASPGTDYGQRIAALATAMAAPVRSR